VSVFADLVGQERVVEQLRAAGRRRGSGGGRLGRQSAAPRRRMTHAWLFTGPPGSGRSVAARAFAAALQCETPAQPGCGHCSGCVQALSGAHPDVALIVPEGLHLTISDARDIIVRSSRAPTRGRWQITLIEDADRMEERTSNTVLKAVEEPPPHSVLLLCAPSVEDLLPTIRSRCRLASLRTPPAEAVASVLVGRDGVDPAMAAFAAQAAQGHIGRAKRLATDEQARRERRDVLSLPRSLQGVGSALTAARDLVDAAQAEATALTATRDVAEKESLANALGAGATGKGVTGATRAGAGALKELEKRQKSRGPAPRGRAGPGAGGPGRLLPRRAAAPARDVDRARARRPAGAGRRHRPGHHPGVDAAAHRRGARLPRGAGGQRGAAARGRGDGAGAAHRLTRHRRRPVSGRPGAGGSCAGRRLRDVLAVSVGVAIDGGLVAIRAAVGTVSLGGHAVPCGVMAALCGGVAAAAARPRVAISSARSEAAQSLSRAPRSRSIAACRRLLPGAGR
jgi:DNA polymerase-3 subunit delta'